MLSVGGLFFLPSSAGALRSSAARATAHSAADTVDEGGHFDFRQVFFGCDGNVLRQTEIIGSLYRAADESVGLALQNGGGADHYVIERLGRCKRHDGHTVCVAQGDGGAGRLRITARCPRCLSS